MSIWLKNTPDEINISDAMKKNRLKPKTRCMNFEKSVKFVA